jgi:molybdenum transport protein
VRDTDFILKQEQIISDSMLDDGELERILCEDVRYGDLTTAALAIGDLPGTISFSARSAMTVCCVEEAARMLVRAGCRCGAPQRRGSQVEPGAWLLEAEGSAAALHRVWKSAQTLIEYASGIATAAARIVAAAGAAGTAPAVVCSRKNFPGTRAVSALAIAAGGAAAHRLGLAETLLVFAEHRVFLQGDLAQHLARVKRQHPEKKLVVEVTEIDEGLAVARAGADIIQLEKFSLEQTAAFVAAVRSLPRPPLVAAAGGINASNAAAYAATGVDILVTSAPFFAAPAEVKVVIAARPTNSHRKD